MTKTSRERRELPVLMRWPHAGNDFSRPSHRGQRNVRSLISSKRLPSLLSGAKMKCAVVAGESLRAWKTARSDGFEIDSGDCGLIHSCE
jgi:hypothetical protein